MLQYVLDPSAVAGEIHRVLKPGGLVYADSPFMQQIAEGGFDFTRFTQSGHRWLFRRFEEIDAGYVGNPGSVLIWSIQYFVRSFGVGDKAARLASLPFFWLRFLERPSKRRLNADAASGVYFLGCKSGRELTPKDIIPYYETQDGAARYSPAPRVRARLNGER